MIATRALARRREYQDVSKLTAVQSAILQPLRVRGLGGVAFYAVSTRRMGIRG